MTSTAYSIVSVVPLDPVPPQPGAARHWHVTYRVPGELGARDLGLVISAVSDAIVAEAVERHLQLHPPGTRV